MEQEKESLAATDNEKTLVAPRFDEEAIHRARPAVPLKEPPVNPPSRIRPAMTDLTSGRWPLALILIVMLVSGVVGGLTSVLYQRHVAAERPAPAQSSSEAPQASNSPVDVSAQAESVSSGEGGREQSEHATGQQSTPAVQTHRPTPYNFESDQQTALGPQEDESQRASLRAALGEWVATTNARDVNRQRDFYMPKVNAFYRSRNVSRDRVLADKGHAFEHADSIDVRAAQPQINIHPDGRTATMRFRKQYQIKGRQQERSGEVVQELKWRRTDKGWKIISERDLKVIR